MSISQFSNAEYGKIIALVAQNANSVCNSFSGRIQALLTALCSFQIKRSSDSSIDETNTTANRLSWTSIQDRNSWLECLGVFAVLALLSSSVPPDINESHYLTKAKHFWNPSWCQGDLFLESANAHYVFFFTCGWPTQFLSLSTFAWCGRIVTWIGFSTSWLYLNRVLSVPRWFTVLSAVLFVLLTNRFDMAGEWIVGGFEAKSVAYVFVVLSIGLLLERRWTFFWVALGCACALHAIVGMWTLFCFMASYLTEAVVNFRKNSSRLVSVSKLPSLGLLLFLVGIVAGCLPPLVGNWGTTAEITNVANYIQVHERLSHHLLFESFPAMHVGRFLLLVVFWVLITRTFLVVARERRFQWFCNGSLVVSIAGVLLSGMAETAGANADWATFCLRHYWFRFSDFAIPLGLAIYCTRFAGAMFVSGSPSKRRAVVFSLCCVALASGLYFVEANKDWRSVADKRSLPHYENDFNRTLKTYGNWKKVCRWIEANTESSSVFVTPVEHQTFKWYAERAEVACWKDIPQDSASIVEWRRRIGQLRGIEAASTLGYLQLSVDQLQYLASEYSVTHLLFLQSMEDAAEKAGKSSLNRLERVYPVDREERSTFVVYKLKSTAETDE